MWKTRIKIIAQKRRPKLQKYLQGNNDTGAIPRFFSIEAYLRAAALGVHDHRLRRAIRYTSFGMAIALAALFGIWVAMRDVK